MNIPKKYRVRTVATIVALTLLSSVALAQTTNSISRFSSPTTIVNSNMFQAGDKIGVNTTAPLDIMSLRFTNTVGNGTGLALQNLGSTATSYSGALMYDHTGTLGVFQGFNNSTKEYRVNNVAVGGTINFLQGTNSRLFVDSSGNTGVGTTTPSHKLNVVHDGSTGIAVKSTASFSVVDIDAASGDAALRFLKAGVSQWNIRNNPATDALQFFELGGGGERMRIDNTTGTVVVAGAFTAVGAKSFTIPHPLDNTKTISHAAVESPEVLNRYSGNIVTGSDGKAIVTLPAYFGAINKDPRYVLTPIGGLVQVTVSKEIAGNRFEIETSKPNVKVSWAVEAVRNDAYMQANPYLAVRAITGDAVASSKQIGSLAVPTSMKN